MSSTLQIKRGTRQRLDELAIKGQLLPGEPLLITDENRLAVAVSTTQYEAAATEGETASGAATWGAITGTLSAQTDLNSALAGKEPSITAGTTSQFWRGDKSWTDFATTVRASTLTGLSTVTNAVITAADTVLSALGKLQKQISDHFGAGGTAHANATTSVAGFMSGTDKTKLDGIAAGAQVNVGTNIAEGTRTTTTVPITSSTGTGATLSAASTTLAGVMTSADKTKLDGIATGATANVGTVTSVGGTGTVSGISLSGTVTNSGNLTLGGTLAVTPSNFASQTANTILAAPNGVAGVPTFRAIVAADVPTLNQNTTGSAATLTTGRTIALTGDVGYTSGSFNGSANVTGVATLASVGTAGTYTKVTTDAKGRVTSGTTLVAADIPALDASKITTGTIDAARLPSYVDDVVEAANLASFPVTGETGKIYVALDTNKTYRWSGSAYVYITSGAVDSVAGKTGVVVLDKNDVGLNNVDNTSDATKSVASAATLTTARTINGVSFNGSANITIADSTKQPLDADLTAIAALAGTSGLLRKTAADTWSLDTNTYVTSSGVTSVSGTAPIVSSGGVTPAISINAATTSTAGSMSAADKTKLDGIATGATANVGTVTSVGGTGTVSGLTLSGSVTSSGSLTLGGTLSVLPSNFSSQTANTFLAAPNGAAGIPTFRGIVAADVPTLNQNTTGSAATLTTARTINGVSFNGSADILVPSIYDATYSRIMHPGGGYYNGGVTVTGAIAIALPVAVYGQSKMISFSVVVYDYANAESFTIKLSGYHYAAGNWLNTTAYIVGDNSTNRNFTIRFAKDTTATRYLVYIGELDSVWAYPKVHITDMQIGHGGGSAGWETGWSIYPEATAFATVGATKTNPQIGYSSTASTANALVLRDASGNFAANAITLGSIQSTGVISVLNGGAAQGIKVGNLVVSSTYANNAPTNGIYVAGQIQSGLATGTSPFNVASTTVNTNLNADLLDGLHAASANTVSTVVARDASGNFSAGTITATLSGNASTVTNGVYTTGSYADPSWLTSVNYTKLTGTVPTWNQNTTGNAATATTLQTARNINGVSFNGSANISIRDIRTSYAGAMDSLTTNGQYYGFQQTGSAYNSISVFDVRVYSPDWIIQTQQAPAATPREFVRARHSGTTWSSWFERLHSGNFNTWSPTLTGTGASGTWGISITGNAGTATSATNVTGTVSIANGGTGATTASAARTNLNAQETLLSGTNIKTINGINLLGAGNATIGSDKSYTEIVATASQTVFSVTYNPLNLDVYLNGVKLNVGDYVASNGTTITLAVGADAGDVLAVATYNNVVLASNRESVIIVSANISAVTFGTYSFDGTAATITLPAGPSSGDWVKVINNSTNYTTCIVSGGLEKISGLAENMTVNIGGAGFQLTYINSTVGWSIF